MRGAQAARDGVPAPRAGFHGPGPRPQGRPQLQLRALDLRGGHVVPSGAAVLCTALQKALHRHTVHSQMPQQRAHPVPPAQRPQAEYVPLRGRWRLRLPKPRRQHRATLLPSPPTSPQRLLPPPSGATERRRRLPQWWWSVQAAGQVAIYFQYAATLFRPDFRSQHSGLRYTSCRGYVSFSHFVSVHTNHMSLKKHTSGSHNHCWKWN